MNIIIPATTERLAQQLAFLLEIDRLKLVLRQTRLLDDPRRENSAEHSWHLAMLALILAEYADQPVDVSHVIRLVLVHDLIEIDAGDTFAYDQIGNLDKAEREQRAADRIFALLPPDQMHFIRTLWDEFELRATAEARFANALDRLMPMLHNYHTVGGTWYAHGVTADQVLRRAAPIADSSPELYELVQQMLAIAVDQGILAPAKPTLTFLHTSPGHIPTFDRLVAEYGSGIPVRHIVDETLLSDARATGVTPQLQQRVASAVVSAAEGAAVVVCTCSTIGSFAENAGHAAGICVQRVDRAMAEAAVRVGRRIVVVAALESTLAPTRALLEEAANTANREITLIDTLCAEAWQHFERGDHAAYIAVIAQCLRAAASQGDVIVLAQASMADAAQLCGDLSIPVLSSPVLGVQAALVAYHYIAILNHL